MELHKMGFNITFHSSKWTLSIFTKSMRNCKSSCKSYLILHYSNVKLFGRLMIISFSCLYGIFYVLFLQLCLFLEDLGLMIAFSIEDTGRLL